MADPNTLIYDETGMLALVEAWERARNGSGGNREAENRATENSLPLAELNGSWYLQITPMGPHEFVEIRGPLRIEVAPPLLRVSGDIYVNTTPPPSGQPFEVLPPVPPSPLVIGTNWYPQLPFDEYTWYLRSTTVIYANGVLTVKFERRIWDRFIAGMQPHEREFLPPDNQGGMLILNCPATSQFAHPRLPNSPTLRLTGTMQIGDTRYWVAATKSSPFYRGCSVLVDIMERGDFVLDKASCEETKLDYVRTFRDEAGMDIAMKIRDVPLRETLNVTIPELNVALENNRSQVFGANIRWVVWMLIGSHRNDPFGIMFDQSPPHREGLAAFWDKRFIDELTPDEAQKKAGEVATKLLRTLIHESGHVFNLQHPKDDVHVVPIGVTLMNQTSDIRRFLAQREPFPCKAAFLFEEHNRTSLIHSPDPQVAPGWKHFGWGHDNLFKGALEPPNALGIAGSSSNAVSSTTEDLVLSLDIPSGLFRGEFVAVRFTLHNGTNVNRRVPASLDLVQGDLRLIVTPPGNIGTSNVRDVVIGCNERKMRDLGPGETLDGVTQIFYTNVGHTFRHVGRYYVSAELSMGDANQTTLVSPKYVVMVRSPLKDFEQKIADLTIDGPAGINVGKAFAMGDFGKDKKARANLRILATKFIKTNTGQAAALLLANAFSRPIRDIRTEHSEIRKAIPEIATRYFDKAAHSLKDEPVNIAVLAAAMASPIEEESPILDSTWDYLTAQLQTTPVGVVAETVERATPDSEKISEALSLLEKLRRSFRPGNRA
jgi:hypothetical protein